MLLIIQMIG